MSTPQTKLRDPESYLNPLQDDIKRAESEVARNRSRVESIGAKYAEKKTDPEAYLNPLPARPPSTPRSLAGTTVTPMTRRVPNGVETIDAGEGYSQPSELFDRPRINVPNLRQIITESRENPDPGAQRNVAIREQVTKERHPTTTRRILGNALTTAQQIVSLPTTGQLPDVLRNEDAIVGEEVNRRIEQANRANTPEMVQARKKFGALDPITRTAASIPATLYSDVLKGSAGALEATDLISGGALSKVASLMGVNTQQVQNYLNQKGNLFKESQSTPLTAEGEEVKRSLQEKLGTIAGEMGVGISELMLLKRSTGLSMAKIMAMETALKTSDQPVRARAKAVADATAMGRILDGQMSRKASAALFGAPTAIQTGTEVVKGTMKPLEAALQTGLQAGTGFAMGGKPRESGETLTKVPDIERVLEKREARVKSYAQEKDGETQPDVNKNIATEQSTAQPLDRSVEGTDAAPRVESTTMEPAHHSAQQLRRTRNTEHGIRGQFKRGKLEQSPEAVGAKEAKAESVKRITEDVRQRDFNSALPNLIDQEFPNSVGSGASSPRRLLDLVPLKTLRLIADQDLSEWSHLSSNTSRIKRAIDKANAAVGITEKNDLGILKNGLPEINKLVDRYEGDWEKTLVAIKDYVADTRTLSDDSPVGRATQTSAAHLGLPAKTKVAPPALLYHGSDRAHDTVQPGSMLTSQPEWAAGYTTKVNPADLSEQFVGKVHEIPFTSGNSLEANTLHDAEQLLITKAQSILGREPVNLREAAEAVHKGTGADAIVVKRNGVVADAISLIERTVSGKLEPQDAIAHAQARGVRVPENLLRASQEQPAESTPSSSATKEPWEMTRSEFEAQRETDAESNSPIVLTGLAHGYGEENPINLKASHRTLVKRAIEDGLPVPPEVLADYPDLQSNPPLQQGQHSVETAPQGETIPPKQAEPATPKTLKQEPEIKTSRLAQGVEAKAIETKLTEGFEGLPEYETVKVKDQAERAAKLLTDNPEQARRIAMGKELPPSEVLPESVFIAVENQALKNGDVETLRDLAMSSSLSLEATGMGQRIRMLAERDPNSAVRAIRDVQLAREGRAGRIGETVRVKRLAKQIKELEEQLTAHSEIMQRQEAELAVRRLRRELQRETRKGERVGKREELAQGRTASKQIIAAEIARLKAERGQGKFLSQGGLGSLDPEGVITKEIGKIARSFVEDGITRLDDLVDSVHGLLQDTVEGLDKRMVRDAISGYGKTVQMSKDEISVKLRELKQLMRDVSSIEDIEKGQRPLRSGLQREPPTQELRESRTRVNAALKEHGLAVERSARSPEGQQKSLLDTTKTRVRNRIEDLNKWIANGKRIVANKTAIIPDAELKGLTAERDRLQLVFKELTAEPKPNPEDVRISNAIKIKERAIADARERLRSGKLESGPTSAPWSPELGKLSHELADLRGQLERRREESTPKADPEAVRIETALKATTRSIEAIQEKLRTGELTNKGTKDAPWSPELGKLKREQVKLQKKLSDARKATRPVVDKQQRAIENALKAANKSIADIETKIKSGNITPTARAKSATSPELEAARAERDVLRGILNDLRTEQGRANKPPVDVYETEAKRLISLRRQLEKQISEYERRIGENDPKLQGTKPATDNIAESLRLRLKHTKELHDSMAEGNRVTTAEVKQIADLSKRVGDAREAMDNGGDRLDYGLSLVNLKNYVGGLKTQAERTSWADIKRRPIRSLGKGAWTALAMSKGLKAAYDLSGTFRPAGLRVLFTQPSIWKQGALRQFRDVWDTYGGNQVMDMVNADIVSRENALNGYYKKAKLDVGIGEEAFPSDVPERAFEYAGKKIEQTRIPIASKVAGRIVGKTYKASQDAYTALHTRWRADIFDKYVEIAKKQGVELDDTQLGAIGRMVNSLTGRGRFGRAENVTQYLNVPFFSPKALKSHIDVLLDPLRGGQEGLAPFGEPKEGTNFVRKEAAKNLAKIVIGTGIMLAIAKAVKPDSVDFDFRSANAGKVKVGNTRFDVTGGWGSLAVLSTRLALWMSSAVTPDKYTVAPFKSSTTGETRFFNERTRTGAKKFNSQTAKDVFFDFFENKESPSFAVLSNIMEGETRRGEKPTVWTSVRDLYEPLPYANYKELKDDPNSAPTLLALILDGLGVGSNTYSAKPKSSDGRPTRPSRQSTPRPTRTPLQRMGIYR